MSCSCGLPSAEECQVLQHRIIIKEVENHEYARVHRLRVDTYCMQHPDIYLISEKSFTAHLLGMCIAMDDENDPKLFQAIRSWEYGKGIVTKPLMLDYFGELTIEHIVNAAFGNEYSRLVKEWAKSVWTIYQPYHELAHQWLHLAKNHYYNE